MENVPVVRRAIQLYANSSADFADCLVLESARSADALPVHTFDRRFARHAEVSLITPEAAPMTTFLRLLADKDKATSLAATCNAGAGWT